MVQSLCLPVIDAARSLDTVPNADVKLRECHLEKATPISGILSAFPFAIASANAGKIIPMVNAPVAPESTSASVCTVRP